MDALGRLVRVRKPDGGTAPWLVLATSRESCIAAVRSDVPHEVAAGLSAAAAQASPSSADEDEIVERCGRLLEETLGRVSLSSGPSYLIPPSVTFISDAVSEARLHLSDGNDIGALRDASPDGGGWSPDEWRQLLEGTLGPWAIATIDREVAAICHSARLALRGAEAGVWTHERFRGRGLAAAVTAAWASLLAPTGRLLFYSTSADNLSSQRVAARLNLRQIGSTWRFAPADHPRS